MGFSRQEYWSGLPFPSPRDPPNPGIEPWFPTFQADTLTSEPPGKSIWSKVVPNLMGFPGGTSVKNPPANAGDLRDTGSIPGLERSTRRGHGNPFLYSCLEDYIDSGAQQATVHRVAELDMTE